MGSLNGDVVVMRNGRSTSQVSVYNYPEHLNPFYEDDQHKRLRFWKINKKEGRRNSFSIGNLKDMWSFKSFRMKKKSSTLGINKTSESPPTLRREYAAGNGWNTFDHRLRSNNTSSINGDHFERNATYRSSLQTLPTNNDRFGLNRNDGYRSTIQVTRSKPRYQPQTQQKQQTSTGVSQQRRSSQSSMVSTNPFDTDNEDDNEDVKSSGMMSVNGDSTNTLSSRTPRKKRRAPAPPTPVHGRPNGEAPPTIQIESSQDNAQDELCIREDMDISNLTAEIQSFVRTKDNDDVETPVKEKVETTIKTTTTISTEAPEVVEKVKTTTSETRINSTITSPVATANMNATTVESPEDVTTSTTQAIGSQTTEMEIAAETKTTTTTKDGGIKCLEKNPNITKVTNEFNETKLTNDSKEVQSNGAIPKKTNNSVDSVTLNQQQQMSHVNDVGLKETNKDDKCREIPIPAKRQTKPETEVGHVECIHVHVESPRSSPRLDHTSSGVSSFKIENVHVESPRLSPRLEHTTSGLSSFKVEHDTEKITTKTPFILTSPPTQRKKDQPVNEGQANLSEKEIGHIVETTNGNERPNELNITEERITTKPEICVKPTLSPKPITEPKGKLHTFAEIHKPMRSKLTIGQNGHVRRASRDEIIPPPMVPITMSKPDDRDEVNIEKKIINSVTHESRVATENTSGNDTELESRAEVKTNETIKIEEISSNTAKLTKGQRHELNSTSAVTVNNNNEARREMLDEFEHLYRPKPSSHMEWKRSTLAPLETHIPPEKRKSVKDIIESINRSQRLLQAAANKDFTVETAPSSSVPVESNNNNNIDMKFLDENEKEFQRLVEELTPSSPIGNASTAAGTSFSNSNGNNEYLETQKLDNNDVFQKSKFKKEVYDYRESSPISSNLDWNPVPKPKRTKPSQE